MTYVIGKLFLITLILITLESKIAKMAKGKKRIFKKLLLVFLGIVIVIQFIRIDKTTPTVEQKQDFISVTSAPDDVAKILKTSCYDCHSYSTAHPWYSKIAPVSWWLKQHIDEGREHLNFSIWGEYSLKEADEKLEECAEEVQKGEMPLSSYTLIHGDAKLSKEQKNILVNFFKSSKVEKSRDY